MLKSTSDRYGAIPVTIHWLTAMLILIALGSGFQAGSLVDSNTKIIFLRIHIPTAILVLLLTVFRIIWWGFFDKKPHSVDNAQKWQRQLAKGVHLTFYIVTLGMVASGIGMMMLSDAGAAIFGGSTVALPNFHHFRPRVPHGLGASFLVLLLFAHVGAALYHHFIRRDGLIWRMWFPLRGTRTEPR